MYDDKRGLEQAFTKVAPKYDLLNHILSFNLDKYWRRLLVRQVPLRAGARVIDLCTGTGDLLFEFAKKEEVVRAIGVDFSAAMLALAQKKSQTNGLAHKAAFVRADVFDPALERGDFDVVSMAFGLRNLPDSAKAIARMAQFSRPGGYVAVLELCPIERGGLSLAHRAYTRSIVPLLGGLLSKAAHEYRYLSSSIQGFLYPEKVMGLMQGAGLDSLRMIKLTGGIAAIFIGRKQ